ncbi:type I secretion system permease/ATPase [Roseovarius sp. SCSIO 43702]|uniref:type I secretion system permease/ATPase n=1 Tax=Roseovarius sp. SCSIO 43702 TaxID=2823043 RepID=UPI001C7386AC|nr:type I secretion system permease/ATPase [Roseovarius sp. SCSIO 43702]QYX56606.1 type I secretion system permease/ATPase [Roseovarius sp. SCSIO 43702]
MSRPHEGGRELAALRRQSRGLLWFTGLLSLVSSLLMLTGPLYMLQVYDRVLSSGSEATLLSLTMLAAFLFAMMALLDWSRGRIMARIGARFHDALRDRLFDAMLGPRGTAPVRNLEAVQRVIVSPVMLALFDLPWVPVFLLGIWIFHPWLGILAIAGGMTLVAVSALHQLALRGPAADAMAAQRRADLAADRLSEAGDTVRGLGMREGARRRWRDAADAALRGQVGVADLGAGFGSLTRAIRLFLQSAMLGLGALLVLGGELGPGAMIAGSILLGRALGPVEQVIGQWSALDQARRGWRGLAQALGDTPPEGATLALTRPAARLDVQQASIAAPGAVRAALRGLSVSVRPGEVLGVIGPSGAGKSSLARGLTGLWPVVAGKIRLDGAPLDRYAGDRLGRLVGYLPQRVELFDATIAANIARLDPDPDPEAVIAAARWAGAHEMILDQPAGYDTVLARDGAPLSGGEVQRIGLARALYGDPVILVLDEADAGLDSAGQAGVTAAVRRFAEAGGAVILTGHRPSSVEACDLLLLLENGLARAFGPRDRVLEELADRRAARAAAGEGASPAGGARKAS